MAPASSEKQRKFMAIELRKVRVGGKSKTGMGEEKLEHFASKPFGKLKSKKKISKSMESC